MKVYVKEHYLRRKIITSGFSVSEFAKKVNVDRSHIYNALNQKSTLSPELAMRIAMVLNTDFDSLFFVGTQEEYEQLKGDEAHV